MHKCNFTYREATTTSTGIRNEIPTDKMDSFMKALIGIQAVRDMLGVPMVVNSWYRSPEVNKAVGGVATSSHMNAEAIDFVPRGMELGAAYDKIAKSGIKFDQLIIYPEKGFIHIGFGSKMRGQLLEK